VALLGAVVAAYKLLGELPAGVLLVVSGIINLLLGRRPPGNGSNGSGVAASSAAGATLLAFAFASNTACSPSLLPDDAELRSLAVKLAQCRAEGRDAGTYDAYDACKRREGIAP
jgi:hypothetical protein